MHSTCPDHPQFSCQRPFAAMVSASVLALALAGPAFAASPCGPCAAKCAPATLNPCAAKNPCVVKNPCAVKS